MKIVVKPLVALVIILGTQLFISLAEEFNTMGPDNLRQYDIWDWIVLLTSTLATLGVTAKAFIDPGFNGNHPKPPTE